MSYKNFFLRPESRPSASLRIICFPYAGGSAATYLSWQKSLPSNVELIAMQPPGRANRMFETAHCDMDKLVKEFLIVISKLQQKPYIFFGHSLGSRMAFELMSHCQQRGYSLPLHFIASGSRGPHIPPRIKQVHHLPEQEFIQELKKLNGTPKEVLENEELMEFYLPLLKADFKLAESYLYKADGEFNCPISVLGGENDVDIKMSDLRSWEKFFTKSADVHMFRGDHFFIESHRTEVVQKINEIILKELSKLNHRSLV